MQIVFLCGGLGTRLKSIANNRPKGLMIINKKPFIEYLISSVVNYEPQSIHFCLGIRSEMYVEHFEKLKKTFKITYSIEDENNLLGTGGAIKNAISFLEQDFVVQYGDTILDIDYNDLYSKHVQSGMKMTMSILPKFLSNEKPNIKCEKKESGYLSCIYDKLNPPEDSNYIDYGAIVFNKSIFESEEKNKFDLSVIQNKLTLNNQTYFYEADKPYIEIGTPDSFRKASAVLK